MVKLEVTLCWLLVVQNVEIRLSDCPVLLMATIQSGSFVKTGPLFFKIHSLVVGWQSLCCVFLIWWHFVTEMIYREVYGFCM